jgi:hypothetical protein
MVLGSETLKEDYLPLFVSSLAKDVVVAYMGSWNEGGWAGCGISSGKGKCHLMSGLFFFLNGEIILNI